MAGEWPMLPIGSLAEIYDGPHATPPMEANGPIFLGIDTLDNGRLNLAATKHISQEVYRQWTRRVRPQPGDLVFSYETRIGQAALVPEGLECCLGRRLALARVDRRKLVPEWLLYYFLAPPFQEVLRAHTKPGSTVDRIHLTEFPGFPVAVPSLGEQQCIADLLSALDDKIELNRRMAETLEATARALFKSWFVDFDPVHAKAGGRPTGLNDDVAALFPSRVGDNGLPIGWRREPLRPDLTTSIVRGISPAYADAGVPVVNQKCIRDGRLTLNKCRFHNADSRHVSPDRYLTVGDALINSTGVGTLGRVAQVQSEVGPVTADSHVTIVKPNLSRISLNLFGLALLDMQEAIGALGQGSTGQTELSRDAVGRLEIVVAGLEAEAVFDRLVSPLRERATLAQAEGRSLATLRDTLLPRLISGELRIRDAERAAAA